MVDCFAVMHVPRRPWLDPESLKQTFFTLSATLHPDRAHSAREADKQQSQDRFTELNEAYQRLRDPKTRLQHLLELETGAPAIQVQRVPADLMEMGMSIGQLCRQADSLLNEKTRSTSPLLQVGIFQQAQEHIQNLRATMDQIESRRQVLLVRLSELDAEWTARSVPGAAIPAELLQKLEELYRLFSYCNRWTEQLQERLTRLSF